MSNFTLLYPSHTLANVFDPHEAIIGHHSLDDIRRNVAAKINRLIEEAELHRFGTASGESDRWYWAAPLLLDGLTPSVKENLAEWLKDDSRFFDTNREQGSEGEESSSKAKHFEELVRCFDNPQEAGLGPVPTDLAEVLADMAIASPAVAALRCVSEQYTPTLSDRTLFAFDLANEFVSLFNKPESIAAVRLSTERASYWRRVLQYCVGGCLQSVLEEFVHIVKADCPSHQELYRRLVESMNLGTSSIKVDDLRSFLKNKRRNMRCHYAVDLGNQRVETDEGQSRIKGIRYNFNSPFRPFVLATTSIGQEGLDFHTYCRKVVHWNLPSNPIDLEQREGRINRFKGLVIRQQIASKYRDLLTEGSVRKSGVWDSLFEVAAEQERSGNGKCDLIPFWHVEADRYQIERIIPFYPFSQDRAKLSALLKTLALYRLAFGQPRQAELVEHLLTNIPEDRIGEIRNKLMIDLSPISYLRCGSDLKCNDGTGNDELMPTKKQIDAILPFLDRFTAKGFRVGNWHDPLGESPSFEYSESVSEFQMALYGNGWITPPFDWEEWQETAWEYVGNPGKIKTADAKTIQKLFTTHVCKERLCEGHLAVMFEIGHMVSLLQRLRELRTSGDGGPVCGASNETR